MAANKSSLAKDIEELMNKSIEANKFFLKEGAQIFRQFNAADGNKSAMGFPPSDLITNAFNAYLQLNLQHAKNLIDLGVSLAKQSVGEKDPDNATTATPTEEATAPAFVLKADTIAGETATVQFLLDNVKTEPVVCKLLHSDYTLEENATITQFVTSFFPQEFELAPGATQTVKIEIATPTRAIPGNYTCQIQVQGFEPAFFSIALTITTPPKQPKPNGRKKSK